MNQQQVMKPLIVCGPSGVGKGTLLKKIKELYPNTFGDSVSHTARKPREGEENGVQYNFVTKETFQTKVNKNQFIEHVEYCGNHYGTSIEAVEKVQQSGLICILEIVVESAEYVKNNVQNVDANYLFITCEGKTQTLKQRMLARKSETEASMKKRLTAAVQEFIFVDENPDFFDCILSNDNLELATQQLVNQLEQWYPSIQKPKYDSFSLKSKETDLLCQLESAQNKIQVLQDENSTLKQMLFAVSVGALLPLYMLASSV
eukprot:UN00734